MIDLVEPQTLYALAIAALCAVLAFCCGYVAGRWQGASRAAGAAGESRHLLKLLDERNSAANGHRLEIQKLNTALQAAQAEHNLEHQRTGQRQQALTEARQQLVAMEQRLEQSQAEIADLNLQLQRKTAEQTEARVTLEGQLKSNTTLKQYNEQLQEKLRESLTDRGRLQGALQTEQKHLLQLQRQINKEHDEKDTAELSLAQIRAEKEELSDRLARAEAQLALVTELKALLQPA